jgi:hypothetical protein
MCRPLSKQLHRYTERHRHTLLGSVCTCIQCAQITNPLPSPPPRCSRSWPQGRATNVRQTDMGANDPFAPPRSPRPRRVPGVRPHPHDLLQEQPVPTRIFDERGGGRTVPKLSGGLFLSPFSRRLRITVCRSSPLGYARKTHYRGLLIRDSRYSRTSSYWFRSHPLHGCCA